MDENQRIRHGKRYTQEEIDELVVARSPYYKATANDVDWLMKVKMQGAIQKWGGPQYQRDGQPAEQCGRRTGQPTLCGGLAFGMQGVVPSIATVRVRA